MEEGINGLKSNLCEAIPSSHPYRYEVYYLLSPSIKHPSLYSYHQSNTNTKSPPRKDTNPEKPKTP
jgi:hypothetical protein